MSNKKVKYPSASKNIEAIYPLSPMQQGMLFHSLYAPERGVYVEQMTLKLKGDVNVAAFKSAWQKLVDRYSILRTFLVWENRPAPLQVVLEQVDLPWTNLDWLALSTAEQQQQLSELLTTQKEQGFQFNQAPLMGCTLIQLSDDIYQFIWNHHHILIDGWCLPIIFKEVLSFYEAELQCETCYLPTPTPYRDYIAWLNVQDQAASTEFWRQTLHGFSAPTPLVVALTPHQSQQQNSNYQELELRLSTEVSRNLQALAQQHHVTLSTILQAAWGLLLSRYSGEPDIVFGVTVSGRPASLSGVENMVGLFINTLPLRLQISPDQQLIPWLEQIQQFMLELQHHSYTPLVKIQSLSEVPGGTPLFESIVVFENYPMDSSLATETGSLQLSEIESYEQTNYPLTVVAVPGDELLVKISYDSGRFAEDTIERMLGHLQTIFAAIAENPQQALSELPLLSEAERHQLLTEWNDTATEYPTDKCIHQLFEQQVEKTPLAVAVMFENQQLTYLQLNQRANQLAHHLQSLGVRPEVLVGICVERSMEMVVGLLGILKAGGAYVPLDPNYPQERLSYMLVDSGVEVLLTQQELLSSLPSHTAQVVCLDADWEQTRQHTQANLDVGVGADNLAYVIYTSGSTGQPKGVAIEHQSPVALCHWAKQTFTTSQLSGVLAATSICFDLSVFELFVTLCVGGKIIVAHNALHIPNLNTAEQITLINTVPSAISELLRIGGIPAQVQTVNLAGEPLQNQIVEQLYQHQNIQRVYNLYGPSEDTTYSTFALVGKGTIEPPSIGRPIANTQIYILDSHLQPVPIGVPGELYIGGDGLARGYLNRPELTQEKFIPNPFSNSKSERLYKTGDLARYLSDGNIEFLGRIDNQVKMRGFRIELGEIEAVLSSHPQIQQAVAIATEDIHSNKRLVAYVVSEEETLNTHQLREFLQQQLPAYMVPSAFVILDTIPLTPNGKIDRLALPAPELESTRAGEYIAPRTPNEEIIAHIFATVLGVETVSIHDNFFKLGGHSLLATQLISRLRQTFAVEIPLRAVFESSSVAQLDQTISQLRTEGQGLNLPAIERIAPNTEELPLSFSQERLWFLNQLEGDSATYNMPAALRLTGEINLAAFHQALAEIVRRHEVLRTSFATVNSTPRQVIHPEATINLEVVDLQHLEDKERELILEQQIQQSALTPFDLEIAPLIRCSVWQLSDTDYVFCINMHHIVSDGWSIDVLVRELSALYPAFCAGAASPLPELEVQYADFTLWQRQWLSGAVLEQQLQYWVSQLQGAPELLQLPTDRPRLSVQTYRGATHSFTLSTEFTQKLQALSRQTGSTLFMTLLAAFATLLYRYSGQSDVVIGSPIANRHRCEIESLIGFFVNTLVLRTRLEEQPSFEQLLQQVRETTLKAYEHQDVPFEQVVEALRPQRSMSHAPLFQVMFVLQNAPLGEIELPGVTLSGLPQENTVTKFDLTLSMSESSVGLDCTWEYNTDLFDGSTIERMAAHFQNLLSAIVENPQLAVGELPLLSEAERHQLLTEWNDTATEYPTDKCIHQLFEQQVEKTPLAVAVVFENQQLTYLQLNQRANQLAHHLQSLGVRPEVLVGVCVERSIEMVVGLLGILKAGGAYVPLDPNYPQERLSYLLADAGVEVLLTQQELLSSLPSQTARLVCLDTDWAAIEHHSHQNLDAGVKSDNLAYVIYTSGSTGQPKGVAIEHLSLCNLAQAQINLFDVEPTSRVLQFASISFDASVAEIFRAVTSGASLILGTASKLMPGDDLKQILHQSSVTHVTLPPSTLAVLPTDELPALGQLIVAGEACPTELAHQWSISRRFFNAYGPTESTVCATVAQISDGSEKISIGRPIANTQIYILDSYLQPVPISVRGELYIGGDGLARGYLNRPELTSQRFIQNPFSPAKSERLYKTGDLARYLSNGNIEFLGRIDNQVKMRGFRIELGEIESILNTHPQIQQAVVIATEDIPGNKRLVAYVVTSDESLTTSQLREFLFSKLPEYMVPSAFVTLDTLPLTPNGKIDRKALPASDTETISNLQYIPPGNRTEEIIADIFASVLSIEKVGIHDNFFELGGHSLLATQVISRVRQAFAVDVSLRNLFEEPTIANLSKIIDNSHLPLVQQLQTTPFYQLENCEEIEL